MEGRPPAATEGAGFRALIITSLRKAVDGTVDGGGSMTFNLSSGIDTVSSHLIRNKGGVKYYGEGERDRGSYHNYYWKTWSFESG